MSVTLLTTTKTLSHLIFSSHFIAPPMGFTLLTQSSCDSLQNQLSKEVRVPMEGLLRKISSLRDDLMSQLSSDAISRQNEEEEEEEKALILSDFTIDCKDDRDFGYIMRGRSCPGSGPGTGTGAGAVEAKCLEQLPLWTASLGGIKRQCESAIMRFDDISALRDLHSGRAELAMQTINPRQFFRDRFERFKGLLREKKINFEMVSEGDFENINVRADPRLLARAFESVFVNAVDGMKDQSSIQVTLIRQLDI